MITVFLTVVLWRRLSESRRKRQDRNTDQPIYANEGQTDHSTRPPPEDESSVYANVTVFKKQR
ncbi:hypothetical protein SRHO_G00179070 [Serrasalmus rhombeus]